jgi:tetratricopeptide (TPR) repeat protein
MLDYYYNNNSFDEPEEPYPDFFFEWDKAISSGKNPGFYEPEELTEIIEIYIINDNIEQAKHAIDFSLNFYSDDEELLYDIFLLLNDYELWNDLLALCDKYKNDADVWGDGHKVTALLHLGMEDEAFLFFRKLKTKFAGDNEDLSIIYQAMGEALYEVDLYESAIDVIQEAIDLLGGNADLYWIQLQCHLSLNEKEEVLELAEVIQKINPLDAETWHRQGVVFQEIGETAKSIDAFEYAQSLGFDPQQNLINLIYAYEKNDNLNKALEKAKEYISVYADSQMVNLIAAKLCAQMENWEEALKYINNTIHIMPELDSLYLYKSSFLLNQDEYTKAKQVLLEGIEKTDDPNGDLKRELLKLNEQYPDF